MSRLPKALMIILLKKKPKVKTAAVKRVKKAADEIADKPEKKTRKKKTE